MRMQELGVLEVVLRIGLLFVELILDVDVDFIGLNGGGGRLRVATEGGVDGGADVPFGCVAGESLSLVGDLRRTAQAYEQPCHQCDGAKLQQNQKM